MNFPERIIPNVKILNPKMVENSERKNPKNFPSSSLLPSALLQLSLERGGRPFTPPLA